MSEKTSNDSPRLAAEHQAVQNLAPANRQRRLEIDRRAKRQDKIIDEIVNMEVQAAQDAGTLRFVARIMAQATMPHKDPGDDVDVWGRRSGALSVTIQPGVYIDENNQPKSIGLPYGSYPRLLLCWVTTEAVRRQEKRLELGPRLSGFMHELGLKVTGGRWGTIDRLHDQMRRLFSSRISAVFDSKADGHWKHVGLQFAEEICLWWDAKKPEQGTLWNSYIELSPKFFDQITDRPIPVDMRALKVLKQSALGLDWYTFLTYRVSYLKKPVNIPWEYWMAQFGAGYPDDPKGRHNFKRESLKQLKLIQQIWPSLKVMPSAGRGKAGGLIIEPSRPHVPRQKPFLPERAPVYSPK